MGGPKALMLLDGAPWWQLQAERIATAGRDQQWVVSPEVHQAMRATGRSLPPVVEADPDSPMFGSVAAGLGSLAERRPAFVHVLPVDVPAASRATLDRLEAAAGEGGTAVPTFAPDAHGVARTGHPLCLSWGAVERLLLPHLARGGSGDPSLRLDVLTGPGRCLVAVDDPAVVANLNTPAELAAWLAEGRAAGDR